MEKRADFGSVYKDFWKRAFDFSGVSSLREYWLPVGLHLGLLLFALVWYLFFKEKNDFTIPFWIVIIYLVIAIVPFVALTVRRLRDTGFSGLWALLLLFVGAGTCVVLALCAAGSGFIPAASVFDPQTNTAAALYGPPPISSSEDSRNTEAADVESSSFDPKTNTAAPLYGPPPTQSVDE